MKPKSKNKLNAAYAAILLAFAAALTIYLASLGKEFFLSATDITFFSITFAASMTAVYTFILFGRKSAEGKTWFLLALGFLLWFGGDFLWFFNEIVLKISPYPSTADISYLAGYVAAGIGLWLEYGIVKETVKRNNIYKMLSIVVCVLAAVSYFLFIPILVSGHDMLSTVISIAYPVCDVFLLATSLLLFFSFGKARVSRSWMLIAVSFMFSATADLIFTYLDWNELYTGALLVLNDMFWITGYLIFALGAYTHRLTMQGER